MQKMYEIDPGQHFAYMILFALIGDKDKTFEFLQKSYEQSNVIMNFLNVEPMYDSLRSDPRFQDLIERMNYPE